jgi:hypothetical protein
VFEFVFVVNQICSMGLESGERGVWFCKSVGLVLFVGFVRFFCFGCRNSMPIRPRQFAKGAQTGRNMAESSSFFV